MTVGGGASGDRYVPDTRLRCGRCGKALASSHSTHRVSATEAVLEMAPDGSGLVTTVKAATTCSWHCLALYVEQWEERPTEEEPF